MDCNADDASGRESGSRPGPQERRRACLYEFERLISALHVIIIQYAYGLIKYRVLRAGKAISPGLVSPTWERGVHIILVSPDGTVPDRPRPEVEMLSLRNLNGDTLHRTPVSISPYESRLISCFG
jgi:hypothetical protein